MRTRRYGLTPHKKHEVVSTCEGWKERSYQESDREWSISNAFREPHEASNSTSTPFTSNFFFASTFASDLTVSFTAGGEVSVGNMMSVSASHTSAQEATGVVRASAPIQRRSAE